MIAMQSESEILIDAQKPATVTQQRWAKSVDAIYRPYFVAAILATLTLGASWGVLLLWKIGAAGAFAGGAGATIQQINAHGEAQIVGWVTLFIMGFAYQAFPRMWRTRLPAPVLAWVVLCFMLAGLAIRSVGMSLEESRLAIPMAIAGALLQVVASWTFAAQILAAFEQSRRKFEPYVGFIFTALAWLAISSVFSLVHTWMTMAAATRDDLMLIVSTYQGPLRDAQIHGLALLMIMGMSLRLLPAMFGIRPASQRRQFIGLSLLSIGVAAEVSFFLAFRWTESRALALCLYVSWMMLAAGVLTIAWPWRLWRPLPRPDRSGKFVRAAYGWLGVSFAMLLLLPLHQIVSGLPFSHAYYGAIRHAITVGFISMMIIGISSKVIPALRGVPRSGLSQLWGPFILLNLGCALRVSMQALTDAMPAMFKLLGISGTLEIAALAWWGSGMLIMLTRSKPAERVPLNIDEAALTRQRVTEQTCSCCTACQEKTAKPSAA